MIYLIYGTENAQMDNFIHDIINEKKINNVSSYDENNDITDVFEDLLYEDLFENNKAVILYNAQKYLYDETYESSFDKVVNYMGNGIYFFIIIKDNKIDNNKMFKSILSRAKVYAFLKNSPYQLKNIIHDLFKNDSYNITTDAVNKIFEIYKAYPDLVYKEAQKLKLYKMETKNIVLNDVLEVVTKMPTNDVFSLIDACINKDYDNIFKIYNDLIASGYDELMILSLITSQYRLYLQTKILSDNNQSLSYIISLTKAHEYSVKKLFALKDKNTTEEIENIILSLYDTEKNIKSGIIDKKDALNMFFLSL